LDLQDVMIWKRLVDTETDKKQIEKSMEWYSTFPVVAENEVVVWIEKGKGPKGNTGDADQDLREDAESAIGTVTKPSWAVSAQVVQQSIQR
jgi:hypothetical protein